MKMDWKAFYDRLNLLIGDQVIQNLKIESDPRERGARFNLLQVEVVQKYYSSTHIWIKGKIRSSNKLNSGWYIHDLECQICKMGATKFHGLGWTGGEFVELKKGELPSRNGHNQLIHQTCEEVVAIRKQYRDKHKGGKCLQCNTYGCPFNYEK